jgi:hypothetical protein
MVGLGNVDNIDRKVARFCNNSWSVAEATNNYFMYVLHHHYFIDTDNNASQHVGYIIIVVLSGFECYCNWSLRCGDGEAQFYGTVTATNFIDQHKD